MSKKNPTMKQKLVMKKIMENNGNVSKSMIQAGYSVQTARNPQQLMKEAGFQALAAQYLPDDLLLKVHTEGLQAMKTISGVSGKDADEKTMDFIDVPDHPTRHKFLETGYKVRKMMKQDDDDDDGVRKTIVHIYLPKRENTHPEDAT